MAVFKNEIVTEIPSDITSIESYLTWIEGELGTETYSTLSEYVLNERDDLVNHMRYIDADTGKLHAIKFFSTPAAATVSKNTMTNMLSGITSPVIDILDVEEIQNSEMETLMLQDQNHI